MVLSDLCNTLCFLCYQIYYTAVHFKRSSANQKLKEFDSLSYVFFTDKEDRAICFTVSKHSWCCKHESCVEKTSCRLVFSKCSHIFKVFMTLEYVTSRRETTHDCWSYSERSVLLLSEIRVRKNPFY